MKKTICLLVLLAGCATQSDPVWVKDGASRADFDSDLGYCRAQAFGVPGAMGNLLQVAIVQRSCMEGRGWHLEQR